MIYAGRWGVRRRVFCLIALAVVGAAAEPEVRQVFGQWSLRCEQAKRGQERCSIVQDVVTRASGQRVVRAAIGLVPGRTEPIALFTLPLGISLPPGASLQIGTAEPVSFPIERCDAQGCRGGLKLGAALLDALKQAQNAELIFHDGQRQPIRVALSLEGFAPALEALR
ncbi:MAG: invasion associated locus B family protein [Gammaproteobacteria bacterium]